jgi:hypothetical protein
MAQYDIQLHWQFNALAEDVWGLIFDVPKWPQWWKNILDSETIIHGFDSGEGSLYMCTIKGFLPHKIHFKLLSSHVQKLNSIESNIHGDISGYVKWSLSPVSKGTRLDCHLHIHDTRPLTYMASFLFFFLFRMNFKHIINSGIKNSGLV